MTEQLKDFDVAEHLTSEKEIQLYLNEVLQEDNVDLILSALGDITRARNMSQIARNAGISREGLYKALSSTGNPTFATVIKVMKALNLQFQVQQSRLAKRKAVKIDRASLPQKHKLNLSCHKRTF